MTPAEIGVLAYDRQQQGEVADDVIRAHLPAEDWSDPEWREAYLDATRAWQTARREASDTANGRCALCSTPLTGMQTKWCSRECWGKARQKARKMDHGFRPDLRRKSS